MSTLDPAETAKLPVRRDLPYNGLTREQVVAIGGDPDAVEAGRLAVNQGLLEDAQRQSETLAMAAARAVAEGGVTGAEAAQQLLAVDRHAHDLFAAAWGAARADRERGRRLLFDAGCRCGDVGRACGGSRRRAPGATGAGAQPGRRESWPRESCSDGGDTAKHARDDPRFA